jgi:hypothetical protein
MVKILKLSCNQYEIFDRLNIIRPYMKKKTKILAGLESRPQVTAVSVSVNQLQAKTFPKSPLMFKL